MKRRFTILTAALALLTFLAVPMGMWGQTHTIGWGSATGTEGTYTNFTAVSGTVQGILSFTTDKNSSQNAPAYNAGASELRLYYASNGDGGSITITPSSGITITSAEMTTSTNPSVKYSVDGGTATSVTASGNTYTISNISATTSLMIQNANTTNTQLRILTIKLTYTLPTNPVISIEPDDIELGEVSVGNETTAEFSVSQANLTSDITLSVDNGSLSTNSIAQGSSTTSVTWTYTPTTAGAINATVTATSGNTTETLAISGTAIVPVPGYAIDFESAANLYTDWTFNNMTSYQTGSITAHGGTYYGTTGGKATASITTTSTVANPGTLTCYVSKQSGNTTSSTWYIQVSENGSTWTEVESHSATSMSQGSWVEFTADLTDYTNVYVRVYYSGSTAIRNIDDLTLTTVEPSSDPSITAADVNIAYDAEEGTINYTINNPEDGGSLVASCNAEWIVVDNTPQTTSTGSIYFTCGANSNFYAHSATVTLTYTYSDSKATVTKDVTVTQALWPEANGSTAEYPIMVSEAIDAIDEVGTVSNIYVGGIVSEIVTAYDSGYGNITFDMIDEEGDEYFVRAYRCVSTDGVDASEVAVGDNVIVKGDLMLYNSSNGSIYELAQGCQLVSLTHPVVPAITVDPSTVEATAAETEGTLNVTYTAIETSLGASIYWYTDNTGTTTTDEPNWISADVDETTLNVNYVIAENNGEARTAYFKVCGADAATNLIYSDLITITQAAAPQQYTLTVEPFENLEIITFVNDVMVMEDDGTIQVTEGDEVMLSIVADEGYVMETLMVNGVNHVNDIAEDFTYTFEMPAENVTISATAVEQVAPVGGDYVRITSLNQLTDGSVVVIAARYDEEHTNGYYAMSNATSGKPTGVLFTSTTSGDNEILPASIVDNEDDYYWVVNETENGYTFTNAEGFLIGYNSSTNFATGGNNTEWSIELSTSEGTAMVANYTGFVITNVNNQVRHFALNSSHNFGPYHDNNINNSGYNFCLDFFVQSEAPVTETKELSIAAGKWYLIASPIEDDVDPVNAGLITYDDENNASTYALYSFDQTQGEEWRNYKAGTFDLVNGMGYLYANQTDCTLTFTGTTSSESSISVSLVKDDEVDLPGYNLVGNPFAETAYIDRPFYRMNSNGTGIITEPTSGGIEAMEGVFVIADEDSEELEFTTTEPEKGSMVALNLSKDRGSVIDRVIVSMGEGRQLPKFQLFENSTKVYIPQNGKDYAVVSSEGQGELPVNFSASENGTYTLSMDVENMDMNYFHLIDNMTGMDIDLLQTPSYTFEANTRDYESRFRLVFAGASTGSATDDNFAFFSNGNFIINNDGNATLQVIDITGRILSSENVNGSVSTTLNATPGVYMLRLINGENVKVQKIVVR